MATPARLYTCTECGMNFAKRSALLEHTVSPPLLHPPTPSPQGVLILFVISERLSSRSADTRSVSLTISFDVC